MTVESGREEGAEERNQENYRWDVAEKIIKVRNEGCRIKKKKHDKIADNIVNIYCYIYP